MSPLPLLKLPLLVINHVITRMSLSEKVNLAMCSNKCGIAVKRSKPKLEYLQIKVAQSSSALVFLPSRTTYDNSLSVHLVKDASTYSRENNTIWLRNGKRAMEYRYITNDTIQGCINMSRFFRSVFIVNSFEYVLDIRNIKFKNLESFVNRVLVGDYATVRLEGRNKMYGDCIELEELSFLMNKIKLDACLDIACTVPAEFTHPKAFKFKSFIYREPNWVTLENLKSIRNSCVVNIGRTSFNSKDINELLHYWTNCEDDMMQYLLIFFNPRIAEIDENVIYNNLEFVRTNNTAIRLIKARNNKRQLLLAQVSLRVGIRIELCAHEPKADDTLILKRLEDKQRLRTINDELMHINERIQEVMRLLSEKINASTSEDDASLRREMDQLEENKAAFNAEISYINEYWRALEA